MLNPAKLMYMNRGALPKRACSTAVLCFLSALTPGLADETEPAGFSLSLVPYIIHTNLHTRYEHAWLIGGEYYFDHRWKMSAAYFVNSFGQECQTVHIGKRFDVFTNKQYFLEASIGVIHGYLPPYNKNAYANEDGWGPSASLSFGYKINPNVDIALDIVAINVYMPRLILRW